MIVKLLNEFDGYKINENIIILSVVIALKKEKGNVSYLIVNNDGSPNYYDEKYTYVLDNTIDNSWKKALIDDIEYASFPEFFEDKHFFNYIVESDWKPEKTKWARELVNKWYQKTIDDFAIKSVGSIEKAKKEIAMNKYKSQLGFYKDRGYETTDLIEPDYSKLDDLPILIDDLQYLNF
jgi:hypothetical protein